MKKQNDLLLLIPDEYNDKFSLSYSRKNLKNINRIYPIQNEYQTINAKGISPKRRINLNNNTFKKYNLLPIISKNGIFFDTNNLNKVNKKSLEGFKPIEDNKIRNKIRMKNYNKPLSVKYLSLHEDNKQFDNYIKSILKINKNNLNIQNNRYDSNNDDFFKNNHNIKDKLNILNKYLNKTYEKEKKEFKKYYNENEDFLNEILANEIITKTTTEFIDEENYKNTNRLFTHFSPIPREADVNPPMNVDSKKSYDTLDRNRFYSNDRKYCPNLKTEKIKKKIKESNDKDLIVHNVFFEWVVDNVILKIENKDIFKNYNSFNKNGTLMKNNIKSILNEEIKNLSKYLFRDESNLNHSYDSLINSLRPISDYSIKIKNGTKENKKLKSADLAKTNYHKINLGDNAFDSSDDYNINNNNYDDSNIEQNILNKLIDKIIYNNKSDAKDLKYVDRNKMKNLNVFIAKRKSNNKKKIFDDNNISIISKSSNANINKSNYIGNKQSFNSFSSQIREESKEPKSEKKNSINLRKNNLDSIVLPKIINNSILRNKYIKNFLVNYYSRNFNNFNNIYTKYVTNSLNADKSTRNLTEQNIQNSLKQEDKLPIIPKINMERKNAEKIINNDKFYNKTIEYKNEQNQTNNDYFDISNDDINDNNDDNDDNNNTLNLNQKLNVNYLHQHVIFEKEAQLFYKNRMCGKNILLNKNKNSYSNKIIGNKKNGLSVVLISSPEKIIKEDDKVNDTKYQNKNKTFIKDKESMEENEFNNKDSLIENYDKSLINSYNENIENKTLNNIENINDNNTINDNKNNKLNSNNSEYEIKINSNGIYKNNDEKEKEAKDKGEYKKFNLKKENRKDNRIEKDINKEIERNEKKDNKIDVRNKKTEEKEKKKK